jgi:hypothetical protein
LPATADREVLNFYTGPIEFLITGAGLDDGFLAEATQLSGVRHALAH